MTAFDHVLVLLSFVYAIAFTHLLSRIGVLINAHARVKWSGLLTLAVVNAGSALVMNWLSLLGFQHQTDWTLLDVIIQLALAVQLYFWCFVSLPEIALDGPIDLEAIYWQQRRIFYIVGLVGIPIDLIDNFEFLKTPFASAILLSDIGAIACVPPMLIALLIPRRSAQWIGGYGLFAMIGVVTGYFTWRLTL